MKKWLQQGAGQMLLCIFWIILATVVGSCFRLAGFPETNIVIVYLLAVLLAARFSSGVGYGLAASVMATFAFNYFFTVPYYSFAVYDPNYFITFMIMTIVSVLTSTLTSRVKESAREAMEREEETQALYSLTNDLTDKKSVEDIVEISVDYIGRILNSDISFLCLEATGTKPCDIRRTPVGIVRLPGENREEVRERFAAHKSAFFAGDEYYEWPVYGDEGLLGVLRLPSADGKKMNDMQKKLLMAMLECTALAMERFRAAMEQLRYRQESEQERYRSNLLRAISHDLRTPLAGIMGTSEMIQDMSGPKDPRGQLAREIWNDADWLHSLVENILNLTRLEDGRLAIQKQPEAVEEIIGNALDHVQKRAPGREIGVEIPQELMLVPMDGKLIVQVLINLLDNALKHTQNGEPIQIKMCRKGKNAVFSVADGGEGISQEDMPHIFEMFYTSQKSSADARRGVGLGLAICSDIIKAHGGSISAQNRESGGAEFIFTLPVEEECHE